MPISFTPSIWLIYYSYTVGTISFVLNFLVIFLIIFKSYKVDSFQYYLLGFQISCTNYVLQLTILSQPMIYFPILAGHCEGLLASYFGIWSHYLIGLIISSAIVEAQFLIGCVVFKHQAIAQVLNKHVVSKKIRLLRKSSYVFVPGSAFLTFLQGSTRREKFIESRYPKYLSEFKNLSNFAIYQFNIWHVFLAGIGIVGGIFCAVTGVYTTVDIFKMLQEVQTKVSSSSFQRNQSAIRSLVSQMLASLMFFVPLFFFVMLIMSDMDNGQFIGEFLQSICALQSIVNAVVLIFTTPCYRSFVLHKPARCRLQQTTTLFLISCNHIL
eukprot:NP_494462.1 Serpentine Receptor, class I [Caenorhabditis elegans]